MAGALCKMRARLARINGVPKMNISIVLLAALACAAPSAARACGETSDCPVDGGTYRIRMPDTAAPVGAIVFAHGYQGSSAGTMKSAGLKTMAAERGLALIALDASGDDWSIPNAPGESTNGRDEMAYLDMVVADAVAQFGIDRENIVIAGFSAGGMFTWNALCDRGDAYAGYIPYSGTFWKGPPASCAAGVQNVIHVHGNADRTVPLVGRAIGETRQGDVTESFAMYGAGTDFLAAETYVLGDMTCGHNVAGGKRLDLCMFDGDHDFRATRLGAAYDLLMQ
jgi:polyhydroxybutyrate depolymerase